MFWNILLIVAGLGVLCSTVFLGLAIVAAWRFRARRFDPTDERLPGISVLKPLHGYENGLDVNLESFFQQDYGRFEIIFGARNENDPALTVVDELRNKYPHVSVKVVLSGEPGYPNAKVYSLEHMIDEADYDYLVISDSDVRVGTGYLAEVTRPLMSRDVGMVTCLYRGLPTGGLWSRLEALGMSVEMTSGVVIADMLEGTNFALGPTMATRKDCLDRIGGIGVLGGYCADDFVLGRKIHDAGYRVLFSHYVIDHVVVNTSFRESFRHQVRWMRSTRYSRPAGHVGTGLTFAMPFALLGLLSTLGSGDDAGFVVFAVGACNRFLQAAAIGWGVVRDPRVKSYWWLYPVHDLIGFAAWCKSFTGPAIVWRGQLYRLELGGKMQPLHQAEEETVMADSSYRSSSRIAVQAEPDIRD
jgi:ceramide glucosyltransferase